MRYCFFGTGTYVPVRIAMNLDQSFIAVVSHRSSRPKDHFPLEASLGGFNCNFAFLPLKGRQPISNHSLGVLARIGVAVVNMMDRGGEYSIYSPRKHCRTRNTGSSSGVRRPFLESHTQSLPSV